MHRYCTYGLEVASAIELPELTASAGGGPVDVTIDLGPVPERLPDLPTERSWWAAGPGVWLQEIADVGRFRVADGRTVRIEVWGPERDVRAFLFGTALGALLHQRGLLTLHASSVLVDGQALLVAGRSRAGKSTTLSTLTDRGLPMIADDKSVVLLDGSRPATIGAYPTMRLRADAVHASGRDVRAMEPLLEGRDDKFVHAVDGAHAGRAAIGAVCVLTVGDVPTPTIETLDGHAAFDALRRNVYRPAMVAALELRSAQFHALTELAAQVPVHRIVRPDGARSEAAVGDLVLSATRATSSRPGAMDTSAAVR